MFSTLKTSLAEAGGLPGTDSCCDQVGLLLASVIATVIKYAAFAVLNGAFALCP